MKDPQKGAAYLAHQIRQQSQRQGRERSEADCRREANERLTRSDNKKH